MLGRTLAVTTLLAAVTLPTTGCFLFQQGGPTAVFVADDVSMIPGARGRAFRTLGEQGEVMILADEVATDVNRWVADIAVGTGELIQELNEARVTDTEGDWRIYGPHNADDGEDAAWMAKISGDEADAAFEIWVGDRGARASDMTVLFSGHIAVDDESRSGGFVIDFDVIKKLAALQDDVDEREDYGGKIEVSFTRDVDTQAKTVDIDFQDFFYVDPEEEEDFDFSNEKYAFHRDQNGAGVFHFATWATLDEEGWSGPERERVTVDMAWDADNAGRARAQALEVEGQGDLRFGDLTLHECFSSGNALTWANINEPYAREYPEYNEGDAGSCLLKESALDGFAQ